MRGEVEGGESGGSEGGSGWGGIEVSEGSKDAHTHTHTHTHTHSISEAEFMQCMEVENHDDFYSFSEDGHVRVWDQGGVGVTYNIAMEDLQKLEGELLTVGSYYIMKEGGKVCVCVCVCLHAHKLNFLISPFSIHPSTSSPHLPSSIQPSSSTSHNLDVGAYSHQHVDRFAVLLDLWTEEAQFLQSKMKVCLTNSHMTHEMCPTPSHDP